MQNAKDSFYMALRSRLAGLNPERVVLVRGAVRPGILVEEAEAPFSQLPDDVYILRWGALGVDAGLESELTAMECEIAYQSCGTQAFGGLDRGRTLAAMDREVTELLRPCATPKFCYTGEVPVAMLTSVFWDEPRFSVILAQRDRLSRSAKVTVYSYREQGE